MHMRQDPAAYVTRLKSNPTVAPIAAILETCGNNAQWSILRDAGIILLFEMIAKQPIAEEMETAIRSFTQCGELILHTNDKTSKGHSQAVIQLFSAARAMRGYALNAILVDPLEVIQAESYRHALQQFLHIMECLQREDIDDFEGARAVLEDEDQDDPAGEELFRVLCVESTVQFLVMHCWLFAPDPATRQACARLKLEYENFPNFDYNLTLKEDYVQAVGTDICMRQVRGMIKSSDVLNALLEDVLGALYAVGDDGPFGALPEYLWTEITDAVWRQLKSGENEFQWKVGSTASGLLDSILHTSPSPTRIILDIVKKRQGVTLMAGMAIAAAHTKVYYAQANEDRPIYILDQLAKHVRKNQKTADPGGLLMEISSRLRPIWLEILDHLRTIDSDASFVVTKIWIHVLGYAFGWNEKSACPRGCSWRGCLLYETDTNKDMFSCAKCHRSRYCDSDCQLRDWKEGGHKEICRFRLSDFIGET